MSYFDYKADLIGSLSWYLEAKDWALKKTLQIRCPLSVERQHELRIGYSQYLANLLSSTELLLRDYKGKDGNAHRRFQEILFRHLDNVFDREGEDHYNYLRELRNAVIHRGYNINNQASVSASGVPLIILPAMMSNQSGKSSYATSERFLLKLIRISDSAIKDSILEHITAENLLLPEESNVKISDVIEYVQKADFVPDWIKKMAMQSFQQEHIQMSNESQLKKFVSLLKDRSQDESIDNIVSGLYEDTGWGYKRFE